MTDIPINFDSERTPRINGVFQIEVGADKFQYIFVQKLLFELDANLFGRSSIGSGKSVFTLNGDVFGSFEFDLKNTVDVYDDVTPAVNEETISFWWQKIKDRDPAIVKFIQTMNAPDSIGDKFARLRFDGRIMTPSLTASDVNDEVDSIVVKGEVTDYTSGLRETS